MDDVSKETGGHPEGNSPPESNPAASAQKTNAGRLPLALSMAALAARLLPAGTKRWLYTFAPLARSIRSRLNRSAPGGLTNVHIAAGMLEGLEMKLDLQVEKDYWLGTYEPELQAAVSDWIKPGWIIYDVGANIGYITLVFARAVGENGKVFSFEAFPANVKRLQENVSLNLGLAPVEVVSAAVIDYNRDVDFMVGPSHGMGKVAGSAGRTDVLYSEKISLKGISLDEFIFEQNNPLPHAVKIDIEGGELLALPGMNRLLTDASPLMFMELHGEEAARNAWQVLVSAGYRISRMQRGYPQVRSVDELDWKTYLVAEKK